MNECVVDSAQRTQRCDRHERIRRCDQDRRRTLDFAEQERHCIVCSVEAHALDGDVVAVLDEVLLERDLFATGECHHRADAIVRHRHHPQSESPRSSQFVGDDGESGAFGEPRGAIQVGGEVAIAQVEPRLTRRRPRGDDVGEPREVVHRDPGLVCEPPAPFRVDCFGEGVDDGIDVGRDVQSMHHRIVGGVDDRRHVRRVGDADHPAEEPCGPDSTCKDRDHTLIVTIVHE